MLMTLAFGELLSQLMRLFVPADARDAGMWVASCLCYATGQLMLMMLVFGWLLVPAGAHARLWLAACPS